MTSTVSAARDRAARVALVVIALIAIVGGTLALLGRSRLETRSTEILVGIGALLGGLSMLRSALGQIGNWAGSPDARAFIAIDMESAPLVVRCRPPSPHGTGVTSAADFWSVTAVSGAIESVAPLLSRRVAGKPTEDFPSSFA